MANKNVILITGANRGLGFVTVKALLQSEQSHEILLGGRSLDSAKQAVADLQKEVPSSKSVAHAVQIDVEDDDSIKRLYEQVSTVYGHLDVLINNAGAQLDRLIDFDDPSSIRSIWNQAWNINVASTNVMTHVFAPLLLKSPKTARLIFVTSGTSTLTGSEDPDFALNKAPEAGWPKPKNMFASYRSSKCGMNMMYREWYRTFKNDNIKVLTVSPGMLATALAGKGTEDTLRKQGAIEPEIGGQFVARVAEGERDDDEGLVAREVNKFYPTPIQPW